MPTKSLPANPSLDHLRNQAKDLLKAHKSRQVDALQRLREFHPRCHGLDDAQIADQKLLLADGYLAIAREYGFRSWQRLRTHLAKERAAQLNLPYHERIEDPVFRLAVGLLDAGDAGGLRELLSEHPALVRQRVLFEGGNYFQNPSLLEFVAENPIRHDRLPANIVEITKLILEAGGKEDRRSLTDTAGLVGSGRVARECGVQGRLIDLLCAYGADPDVAIGAALAHGEFAAVESFVRNGATIDLKVAAATGNLDVARKSLPNADRETRHFALAFATAFGHGPIVRLLIDAGEDPDRYNPPGAHAHSTPMHQAALENHVDVLKLLIERGANPNRLDILFHGTPLDWANHNGRGEAADFLRSMGGKSAADL